MLFVTLLVCLFSGTFTFTMGMGAWEDGKTLVAAVNFGFTAANLGGCVILALRAIAS